MAEKKEFKLSEKTSVFVTSKAKTSNRPYAALCRNSPDGPRRYFYMSLQKLVEILKLLTNIQILLRRDTIKEQSLAVDQNISLTVSTFLGKKYVGFVNTGNHPRRMNINSEEFKVLVKTKSAINTFIQTIMQKQQTKTIPMETDTGPTVTMHKWGYFNVENGEMVQESEKWYFDMETCQEEGVAAEPSVDLLPMDKAPEFFTFSSLFTVPEESIMIKQAYIYVLKCSIERLRDKDCFPCMQNIPMTNSMHDDGCCMDWDEAVAKFMDTALLQGPREDVKRICSYIQGKMSEDNQPVFPLQVTQASRPLAHEVENWRMNLKGEYDLYRAADDAC